MSIATGSAKQIAYKVESTFGTAAGASGAALLNRVTSDIEQTKSTFKSATISPTMQVSGFSHGVKKVAGTLKGELGPGQYSDFIDAFLRRARTAVSAITSLTITIAGSSTIGKIGSSELKPELMTAGQRYVYASVAGATTIPIAVFVEGAAYNLPASQFNSAQVTTQINNP